MISAWPCSLVWSMENLHWILLLHFSFKREGTQNLIWSQVLFPSGTFPLSVLFLVSVLGTLQTEVLIWTRGRCWVMQGRHGSLSSGSSAYPVFVANPQCHHSPLIPEGHVPTGQPNCLSHNPCKVCHYRALLVCFLCFLGARGTSSVEASWGVVAGQTMQGPPQLLRCVLVIT